MWKSLLVIPSSNAELRWLRNKRYNKVVQAGQWQRSQQHFKDAIDFVHSGQLGNIRTVKVWCYLTGKQPILAKPDSAVPAELIIQGGLAHHQRGPLTKTAILRSVGFGIMPVD